MLIRNAGTSKEIPSDEKWIIFTHQTTTISRPVNFFHSVATRNRIFIRFFNFKTLKMASNVFMNSTDSNVFFMEQPSSGPSLQRYNSPNILRSSEWSATHTGEMPTISSVKSPEPDFVTLDDDFNESTMPYGFGQQLPIIPPSLNNLNLPPSPFNIVATRAVVNPTDDGYDENCSP